MTDINIDPYRPLLGTLSDQKSARLAVKYIDKKQKHDPIPEPGPDLEPERNLYGGLAESGLYRMGGNLADLGRYASNKIFGTTFDDRREVGMSDQTIADEMAGVTTEQRAYAQGKIENVGTQYDEHGLLSLATLKAAAEAGPTALADSAATIGGYAAGGIPRLGATGLAAGGKALLGIGKSTAEAGKIAKGAKAIKDSALQASVIAADIVQQETADYREKYGEDPSTERVMVNAVGALATSMLQGEVITKLMLPNVKKQLMKEGRELVSNMPMSKSNIAHVAKRMGEGLAKIGGAAGGEAVQEYLQTWQEIFATEISPEAADDLFAAVKEQIMSPAARKEAAVGGLVGASAGGVARGLTTVPAVAAGTAADVSIAATKGTISAASTLAAKVGNAAALKALNEEEREVIRSEYNSRREIINQKKADFDSKIDTVQKATNIDELLQDPEIAPIVQKVSEDMELDDIDIKKARNIKRIKAKVTSMYKGDQAQLELEFGATNVARVGKQLGKKATKVAKKVVESVKEEIPIDKIVEKTKQYGLATVNTVKELDSSTARGVLNLALDKGEEATKDVLARAKKLRPGDVQRIAAVLKKKYPDSDMVKGLNSIAAEGIKAQKRFGIKTGEIISDVNLPPQLASVAFKGKVDPRDTAQIALQLQRVTAGKIDDKETLQVVKDALKAYKSSNLSNQKGAMSEMALISLETRLAHAGTRLNREFTKENAEQLARDMKAAYLNVKKKTKAAVKTAKDSDTAKGLKKKLKAAKTAAIKAADAVDKKLEEVEETVVEKAEELKEGPRTLKSEPVKGFIKTIDLLAEKSPEQIADKVEFLPGLIKKLKEEGYKTSKDLTDLVTEFPSLKANEEFYKALQKEFGTEVKPEAKAEVETEEDPSVVIEEQLDNVTFKSATGQFVLDMYEAFTGCKK